MTTAAPATTPHTAPTRATAPASAPTPALAAAPASAPTTATPAIHCQDVSLSYKRQPALSNLSFTLEQNVICGLLGRNAAGKTSLLSLLAAYRRPKSGSLRILGQNPYENPAITSQVAFVFNRDKDAIASGFKPRDYFRLASITRPNWDDALANHLLERFAIPRKKLASSLSTGQRAALNCVVGIATRAPLTLFDEAYLGMDAVYRKVFIDELLADYQAFPRTILFSTHYIGEMERLFSEVLIIANGSVLLHDDCDTLRQQGHNLQDLFISLTQQEGETHAL